MNVELGSGESLHYTQDLVGEEAHIVHDLAYLGDNNQKFDISMLMSHVAPKSVSDIHVLGALGDNAKKSFRGTLISFAAVLLPKVRKKILVYYLIRLLNPYPYRYCSVKKTM